MTRRVVVTGMSGVTSLGNDWADIRAAMENGRTGIRRMDDWAQKYDLSTCLAGPVQDFSLSGKYSRKQLRSMGRVSQMAVYSTDRALQMAGLRDDESLFRSGRMGVSYGSSFGSTPPILAFARLMTEGNSTGITATSYVQMMSHTAAVNIGVFFGLTGRVIPTSTACTSGSMGLGYAYEAIKYGMQDVMIAGGAEELCPTEVAVFDTLFATSVRNDEPDLTPSPYDKNRDGLVIGEGAGSLILEEYGHAKARGAKILGEIVGFGTNSDGAHVTQPSAGTMAVALTNALADADLSSDAIGFISGHGTATDQGDIAETQATRAVFDRLVPIHSLKSYFGHTLGACGAVEVWLSLEMMHDNWYPPTANLDIVDDDCGELDYLQNSARELHCEYVMSNNFAFGGINTSLILKRFQ